MSDHEETPSQPPSIALPAGSKVHSIADGVALLEIPLRDLVVPEDLTDAERDVAIRICGGDSTAAIAKARGVSPKTVSNQIETLYRKLGVNSRSELVLALLGPTSTDP